jgi:hypothetical protein
LRALRANRRVAVTIDDNAWPHKVLLIRGDASIDMLTQVSEEYALAARRYFGDEQGQAWADQLRDKPMARIKVRPDWTAILDFRLDSLARSRSSPSPWGANFWRPPA